jgi:hypothetical protein
MGKFSSQGAESDFGYFQKSPTHSGSFRPHQPAVKSFAYQEGREMVSLLRQQLNAVVVDEDSLPPDTLPSQ